MDLDFSKDMFDIIDNTKHNFEIIDDASSLLLETITYNSTSYPNCIFQNKIYYLIVSKIAILNDDHDIYHSSLLNIEKKNLSNIFLKIYLFIILLKVILPKRHNCLYNENCNYRI